MPLAILASLLVTSAPAPAPAEAPACRGTLAGAVTATFPCDASIVRDAGREFLVIATRGPVEGVPAVVPGSFEVTGLLRPGTYGLDRLGPGKASVAAEDRTLFTATKTQGTRGEATLTVESVEPGADASVPRVKGAWRARLLPVGGGKRGEVTITVEFRT